MFNYQQALQVASDIEQGTGSAYDGATLRSAASTLIRASGEFDLNSNPATLAAYRTIARYERARALYGE